MKVTVLQGQSLLDIAVQSCGTAEADFLIASLNGLAVTDELKAGQVLEVPQAINKRVADYYDNRNIKPATFQPDGIEYTGIEYDFIIE